jgi:hypothetical protein
MSRADNPRLIPTKRSILLAVLFATKRPNVSHQAGDSLGARIAFERPLEAANLPSPIHSFTHPRLGYIIGICPNGLSGLESGEPA